MNEKLPLEKVDKKDLEKMMAQLTEAFSVLVNKEISGIQSDVQRILNVVQVGGMDKADR